MNYIHVRGIEKKCYFYRSKSYVLLTMIVVIKDFIDSFFYFLTFRKYSADRLLFLGKMVMARRRSIVLQYYLEQKLQLGCIFSLILNSMYIRTFRNTVNLDLANSRFYEPISFRFTLTLLF